jgi:DNA-binding NtrC family response regulator
MGSKEFTHSLERGAIRSALEKTDGNLKEASKLLEMPYSTLNYKLRVLGLLQYARTLRAKAVIRKSDE